MTRVLGWVDGVNSAVAVFLAMSAGVPVEPMHCDLGDSVHPDNHRFIDDLERFYGVPITRIKSAEYDNIDECFEDRRYLSGPKGAPCTGALKFVPRLNYQLPSDTHLWGYAADRLDAARFDRMLRDFPDLKQRAPLIELGITKAETHAMLPYWGLRRPRVYDLGLPNGNCLCCVKAQSRHYWALMRLLFPEHFARRNDQARRFGARPVILRREKDANGKWKNIRGFPDEVPLDTAPIIKGSFGGWGFHCTGSN